MVKTLANIKKLGNIVEVSGDFYSALQQLKEAGAELISPRDEAYARIATDRKEKIGRSYGTWTSAGFESAKDHFPLMRLSSRLLNPELAKQAVEANRKESYFTTETPDENWEIAEFALKDKAREYFDINKNPITLYLVDKNIVDKQSGTLLTQLWFGFLDYRSDFYGNYRYLDDGSGARGVKVSAEGTQKILPYTEELGNCLQIAQGVRTGNLPASKLEQLIRFLESLKE